MNTQAPPRSFDALWFVTCGAPAAWIHINDVQGSQADAVAALAEEDFGTTVEACAETLKSVIHCELVLDGYQGGCGAAELDLHVVHGDSAAAGVLRALPPGHRADATSAATAMTELNAVVDDLKQRLPLEIPIIRSAAGFFPSVRMGGDIERLRKQLGLGPIDWMSWSAG